MGSSTGTLDNDAQENQRRSFWQLVLADVFYRLCYDKPSSISSEACTKHVWLADRPDPSRHQSSVSTVTSVLWGRIIFILKDFFEFWDTKNGAHESPECQAKLEVIVDQIESLLEDWDVVCTVSVLQTPQNMLTVLPARSNKSAQHCNGSDMGICRRHLQRVQLY